MSRSRLRDRNLRIFPKPNVLADVSRALETERGYFWSDTLGWPYKLRRPFSRSRVGRWGEWLALRHLRRLRWDVVARNWRTGWGELDLVVFDEETLVFVEVRTRLQIGGIPPESTVDRRKEFQVESLGRDFMSRHELWEQPFRIDVIAIETPDGASFELRHSRG